MCTSALLKSVVGVLLCAAGAVLSPTRALAEYFKPVNGDAARFMRSWNLSFLSIALVTWGLLCAVDGGNGSVTPLLWIYLWVLPFSRVNEILSVFLQDGLARIKGTRQGTALTPYDRVILVSRSYLEVILDFAILYYLGFRSAFSHQITGAVEALYFSAITITTVGYGDLAPCRSVTQLLVVYEVLGGLVLILVAFGAYIDKAKQ